MGLDASAVVLFCRFLEQHRDPLPASISYRMPDFQLTVLKGQKAKSVPNSLQQHLNYTRACMVARAVNSSTGEAEAGGCLDCESEPAWSTF